MFDLNGKEFSGSSIFNGGNAGKVDNVSISVEKKQATEPQNYPDYKLVITDEGGSTINSGFYYPSANPSRSDEDNKKAENREIGRVLHLAKTVMGKDYEFPTVSSAKEAFDVLFKIVKDNAGAKKYNVFATYGTKSYPNKKGFLGLRYFNFIEDAAVPTGTLKVGNSDLMERITPDAPSESKVESTGGWS